MDGGRRWTDDELRDAVAAATTLSEAIRGIGLRAAGGNFQTIRAHIARLGLDTSHFAPRTRTGKLVPKSLEEVLVRGSTYHRGHLKDRLYAAGVKRPCCELCGQGEDWHGKRMSLILDHVNGEHDDNRIENLRIVCPNCNATLDTHCGRQNRRPDRTCRACGAPFRPTHASHRFCSQSCAAQRRLDDPRRIALQKVARPSEATLLAELQTSTFTAVGRKYGVSDNAVRKWLRFYERERQRGG